MFLRFTLLSQDSQSHRKTGLLVAAHELRDEGELSPEQHAKLRGVLGWFNEHLYHPRCLGEPENDRALSWFKPGGSHAVSRMWELVEVFRAVGVPVEIHKTQDPGIILYEDKWQLVAKPRKGSKANW